MQIIISYSHFHNRPLGLSFSGFGQIETLVQIEASIRQVGLARFDRSDLKTFIKTKWKIISQHVWDEKITDWVLNLEC